MSTSVDRNIDVLGIDYGIYSREVVQCVIKNDYWIIIRTVKGAIKASNLISNIVEDMAVLGSAISNIIAID